MRVLLHARGGTTEKMSVTGPMGVRVEAALGLLDDGKSAVIEMASAAGLHLVPPSERNPMQATTRGVGELIIRALDLQVEDIIVGLGGSATNDGGAGMAQALGARLLDAEGMELPLGGGALARLHTVDLSQLDSRLRRVRVTGACDVSSPLCGALGASHVYGPQKGASPEMVRSLDAALNHYGRMVSESTGVDLLSLPGGGAAGGLGAGLAAFTGAELCSGVHLVFNAYGDMDEQVRSADLVISGEGCVDGQTIHGKVIAGVAALTRKHNKPLVVLAGSSRGDLGPLYDAGVTAVFPIAAEPMGLSEAMGRTAEHLARCAGNVVRLAARADKGGAHG